MSQTPKVVRCRNLQSSLLSVEYYRSIIQESEMTEQFYSVRQTLKCIHYHGDKLCMSVQETQLSPVHTV